MKAQGKVYHPGCLSCTSCDRNLDGVPFTVDVSNNIDCVECYQLKEMLSQLTHKLSWMYMTDAYLELC